MGIRRGLVSPGKSKLIIRESSKNVLVYTVLYRYIYLYVLFAPLLYSLIHYCYHQGNLLTRLRTYGLAKEAPRKTLPSPWTFFCGCPWDLFV